MRIEVKNSDTENANRRANVRVVEHAFKVAQAFILHLNNLTPQEEHTEAAQE